MTQTHAPIPMPTLIGERRPAASDHDPATSHEHGPIEGRPTNDPSNIDINDPVAVYARQLWTELDAVRRYLVEDVAHGGAGPLLARRQPLLTNEDEWAAWRVQYASVLGVLAGPAGDEGYGEQEAQLEYQNRATR
jgi:hypothetical protein